VADRPGRHAAFSTARRNFGKVDAFLSRGHKKACKNIRRRSVFLNGPDAEGPHRPGGSPGHRKARQRPLSAILIDVSSHKAMTENHIFARLTDRTGVK